MANMSEIVWMAATVGIGLAFGLALLPWKQRLYRGREWWIIWGAFWPFMILYAIWFGLLAYRDAWTTYFAERAFQRRKNR